MLKIKMSSKGQIAIPKKLRNQLLLQQGTELSITLEGDRLILRKVVPRDWRRWEGALANLDLLAERVSERQRELQRDAEKLR